MIIIDNNLKLNLDIPQEKIEQMAKQVIRELIESEIKTVMSNIDVEQIINNKVKTIDKKITKITKKAINKNIKDMNWKIESELDGIIRNVILEEIQKKLLSGNIYLKIDSNNIETDYDY